MTSVVDETSTSEPVDQAHIPDTADRRWIVGLSVVSAAYLYVCAVGLTVRSPLGHDESVYALRARDLENGWGLDIGSYWAGYRAPGLSIMLAGLNGLIGSHVATMRLLVVGLGLVLILGTVWVAHEFGQRRAGVIGAGLLAITSGYGLTSTRLLADIPGAVFAMLAIAVFAHDFRRGRLAVSLWAVPLLTFASTVSRFGAPIMLGAGLASVGLVLIPGVCRAKNWALLVQSAGLAAALGLVIALVVFTNWLNHGPASPAQSNQLLFESKSLTPSTGFSDLWRVINPWSDFPNPMWSGAVLGVWAVGVVLSVVAVVVGGRAWEPVVFGLAAGLVSVLGVAYTVGLVVENYLVLSLPFWAIAAGVGYSWVASELRILVADRALLMIGTALCALGGAWLVQSAAADVRDHHDGLTTSFATLRESSVAAGEQLGDDCVLITSYGPQAGYYSQCRISPWRGIEPDRPLPAILDESLTSALGRVEPDSGPSSTGILVLDGGKRQPLDETLDEGVGLDRILVEVGDPELRSNRARAFTLAPCVWRREC